MLPGHAVLPQGRTPVRKGGQASQTRKKCFVNDIEHFGEKAFGMFSVKKC
jgi:hypothetical protein